MTTILLTLAAKLPAGINDQRALEKFDREFCELQDELAKADRLGALLEAADCMYYAVKAEYVGLLESDEVSGRMAEVYRLSGFTPTQVYQAAIIKYTMRSRPGNPKDDKSERLAVEHLV